MLLCCCCTCLLLLYRNRPVTVPKTTRSRCLCFGCSKRARPARLVLAPRGSCVGLTLNPPPWLVHGNPPTAHRSGESDLGGWREGQGNGLHLFLTANYCSCHKNRSLFLSAMGSGERSLSMSKVLSEIDLDNVPLPHLSFAKRNRAYSSVYTI